MILVVEKVKENHILYISVGGVGQGRGREHQLNKSLLQSKENLWFMWPG